MGAAGDHRRRRHRTAAMGAGLAVVAAMTVAGGRDPTPPPPLPPLAAGRADVELVVAAEHDGAAALRIDLDVAVAPGGDVLTVASWDDGGVVAERLPEGQVVVHVGLAEPPPPEPPDGVLTMAPVLPPPPPLVMPGPPAEATLRVDGPGPRVSGIQPADGDDLRRIDEVRVCLWSLHERDRDDRPVACADDGL